MFNKFFPDLYYNSTYSIDFKGFYEDGYRGIIFDIDNTLVPHGDPADERSRMLISDLKDMGFSVLFLSNNKEPRVKSFAEAVGGQYIYKGGKPSKKGYLKAIDMMGTDIDTTLFVGDQLFTDVWGAKRTGVKSLLVKPIDKREEIQIILKRRLEWIVLWQYKRLCHKNGITFLLK